MHNKIFISYATEDYHYADKLHSFLSSNGYEPWMDKKNLLPGQKWDYEIQRALRSADFVIMLLSNISVNKRGYVQKEFKKAVIYCEEKLDSDIYIIPIKIDDCTIPIDLNKFQWIEFSPTDTFDKILNSINIQRQILLKEEEAKKYRLHGFEYQIQNRQGEYGTTNPKQLYELSYPQFKNITNESLGEINILIEGLIVNDLLNIRYSYYNHLIDIDFNNDDFIIDSTSNTTVKFELLNKKFVSFTYFNSSYYTGAAHGDYGTSGYNYLMNPLRKFDLRDLFECFSDVLPLLRDIVYKKLLEWAEGFVDDNTPFYDEELEAKEENFTNYFFNENALIFIYNPYELTYWSNGDQLPEITYEELIEYFPTEKKLMDFIDNIKS